jgi:hypothetical protein
VTREAAIESLDVQRKRLEFYEDRLDQVTARAVRRADLERIGGRQLEILADLLLRARQAGSEEVPWAAGPQTAYQSQATSRALRSLEERGLIVRLREAGRSGMVTTRIRADAGRDTSREARP